jgi:hypothetical protein
MKHIRTAWKAVVGFVGGFAGPVIVAATDSLRELDWSNVDVATIRAALLTGLVTGAGVWAKTNAPQDQPGRHEA